MKLSLKKVTLSVLTVAMATVGTLSSFAETIGYVNLEQVVNGYDKAQNTFADIKVREAEIRKQQAEFMRQIRANEKANAKSPVGNDTASKQLKDKLAASLNEFKSWSEKQQTELDGSIDTTIRNVAKQKNIAVVVNQQAVILGGVDITADVINALNTSK
jgi:outer membrane protein